MIQISQSLIKMIDPDPDTEQPRGCPKRINSIYVDKLFEDPTDTMSYGLFFESGILGRTRDGEMVDDLPRTFKKQEKRADHVRLEKQIERWHSTIRPFFQIDTTVADNIHPEITVPWNDRYSIVCHLDLITPFMDPTLDQNHPVPVAIVDTKVCESILTRFGDYSWGAPHLMDHIQAFLYTWAYMKKYPDRPQPPFYYMIFEYGPRMEYKVIRKLVRPIDLLETETRIRRTVATLDLWQEQGWAPSPSYDSCQRCRLKDACDAYKIGRDIQVV